MNRTELEKRIKQFHINIIKLCKDLPKNTAGFETGGGQIIRSAGSVGSNYRATKRAKSTANFIYKIEVVLEESDESLYWLEIIKESELLNNKLLNELILEANELTAIFTATDKTAKANKRNNKK